MVKLCMPSQHQDRHLAAAFSVVFLKIIDIVVSRGICLSACLKVNFCDL